MIRVDESLFRKRWVWWAIYVSFWTALGLSNAGQSYFLRSIYGTRIEWGKMIFAGISDWYVWAAFAPVILWLVRRLPFTHRSWLYLLLMHGGVNLLVSVVISTLLVPVMRFCWCPDAGRPPESFLAFFQLNLIRTIVSNLWVYWAILFVCQAYEYYRKYRERELRASNLEAQLAQAQLQVLKMQLHPHFLFNTLNAISALMHQDVELADRMLDRLGTLLRSTLENAGDDEVPFWQEVEFMQPYLEIEQARLGSRLHVHMSCDPALTEALVPNFMWQPVVENAIRHGIAPRPQGGHLYLRAQRLGERVRLEVEDDGPGLPGTPEEALGKGVGLSNTRARLQQLYGAEHSLELRRGEKGGLLVRLEIPYREATPEPALQYDLEPQRGALSVA
jgi:signal transduction histidine kinase